MRSAIRASTPADAPAIVALFAERRMLGNFDAEYLSWKYWQPRADWPGSRSFVLARDSELIAHAAVIPVVCAWESRRVTMLHTIDWVAREGSGAGIVLMKYLARMAEALFGIGGGVETRSLLPHLGFRPAGVVTGFARPLFPLRILRGGATWKLVPRMARAIRRRSMPAVPPSPWRARALAADEFAQIIPVLPRSIDGLAVTVRSTGLFEYLLSCPTVPMRVYAAENAERVRGYFLLSSAAGQVRIADCWMDSQEPADWRAMILCAVAEAQHDPQAAEIVAWASDPLLALELRSCGFYPRFESPIHLRPSVAYAMPPGTLRVQMLDNDAVFLCTSRNEYWG
jgi:hypothetical protein